MTEKKKKKMERCQLNFGFHPNDQDFWSQPIHALVAL
jgi:hypothetical protein